MNSSDTLQGLRRKQDPDDSLIPLINIVFLLLIFFMVAGQIGNQDALPIDSPTSASDTPLPPATLELSLDAAGVLHRDGAVLALDDLPALLRMKDAEGAPPAVILRADKAATAEALDAVFARLREEGIAKLTLRTRLQEQP